MTENEHPYPEYLPPALDRVWVAVDEAERRMSVDLTTADRAIIAAQADSTTNNVAYVRDGQVVPLTGGELDALRWELGRIKHSMKFWA